MHATRLLQVARDWFDEATVARVFEPMLADWRHECAHATGGRRTRSLIHGYLAFARSFAAEFPRRMCGPLHLDVTPSTWLLIELFVLAGVAVSYGLWFAFSDTEATRHLLPSMFTLALPFAMVPASIIVLTRRSFPAADCRIAIARMTLVCCLAMVPLSGWITPPANQRHREQVAQLRNLRQPVWRGVRELTLNDLLAPTAPRDLMAPDLSRWRELQRRASFALLPITLALVGLAAGRSARHPVLRALAWWVAVATLCLVVGRVGDGLFGRWGYAVGFWPAHATLLIIAVVAGLKSRPTRERTWRAGL